MKKIYSIFAMVMIVTFATGQGTSCNTAISLIPQNTCVYQSFTTTAGYSVMWFSFIAQSPYISISVFTTKFGIDTAHIHQLAILGGTCGSVTVIAGDELPFVYDADKLQIDLDASGLTIGTTYYIRVKREATDTCDKVSCTASGSTSPTTFDLCIQTVNVILPLDFGIELPSISHAFQQNRGQLIDVNGNPTPDIKLYTISANPAVYLTDSSVSYVFAKVDTIAATIDTLHRVDMTLEGANTGTKVFKTEEIPGITNYFLAHIPKGVTRNKGFERAVINEVYPLIDMQVYSNSVGIKYYFIVRPGGDPDNIVMKFEGANAVNVNASGGLQIVTSLGNIDFESGHAYRINPGNNIVPMPWQAKFVSLGNNKVKLDIHNYDHNMPLFIQIDRGHQTPPISSAKNNVWSTYFKGSSNGGKGYDITTDNSGNMYITGSVASSGFPVTTGAAYGQYKWLDDAFIGRFDNNSRNWVTYFGGSADDAAYGIVFDNNTQNIYITGATQSSNLPVPLNNVGDYKQLANAGGWDAFIAKFELGFGLPLWFSYFGGAGLDQAYSIDADNDGNIYIAGRTNTSTYQYTTFCGLPTDGSLPLCNPDGWPPSGDAYFEFIFDGDMDGFLAKFSKWGILTWSTLFGGDGYDAILKIAVNKSSRDLYITGTTTIQSNIGNGNTTAPCNSMNLEFPLCNPGSNAFFQLQPGSIYTPNSTDGFIAHFDPQHRLMWSTYFGSAADDVFNSIAVAPSGDIYVAGQTSTNFQTSTGCNYFNTDRIIACNPGNGAYFQNIPGGNTDALIARFSSTGQLKWSTLYGKDGYDYPYTGGVSGWQDIAIDSDGNLFITGTTNSVSGTDDFPVKDLAGAYYQPENASPSDVEDAFLICFNSDNQLKWSTLYGGAGNSILGYDEGLAITAYQNNTLYMTGTTFSASFPFECPGTVSPYCDGTNPTNKQSTFIVRFDLGVLNAIENLSENAENFTAFPNPTSGVLALNLPKENSPMVICLYNSIGSLIKREVLYKHYGQYELNLSLLSNGIYMIQIETGRNIFNKKIIVQK